MSATYVRTFERLGKRDISAAGGKGANLGELTRAGLPVPSGFVLTTEAYDAFIQHHGLQERIIQTVSNAQANDLAAIEQAADEIRRLFRDASLPDDVVKALGAAYAQLGAGESVAVAVRSSATAEDLPAASFAGQQDTYLNVKGMDALLAAVKHCWASLWTARAISYRSRQGVGHHSVLMGVVVQTMIPAEVAGILFTANPATGARDELVVNASFGLGEAVVAGEVSPDSYVVDRESLTLREVRLGAKEMMIVAADPNGDGEHTKQQPVPAARQGEAALEDRLLSELAALGLEVEELFGAPQDIEWAVADGTIWLLQARPITNLPPAPLQDVRWEPPIPGTVWMRRQVVEHMPEPLSPLFAELYVQEGLTQSVTELLYFMSGLRDLMRLVQEFLPGPFALTINGYAYTIASFDFQWKHIPRFLRMYAQALPALFRQGIPHWRDEAIPAYQQKIEYWKEQDLAAASDMNLLRGVRELAVADAVYWFAAAVPLGLARVTDALLESFLKSIASDNRAANDGPLPSSGPYLRGFPSKAVEAQAELETIAAQIRQDETLHEAVLSTPAPRLLEVLSDHPRGQAILERLQDYLDRYGHQIYNLDFAAPTQADDPLPVLLSLAAAVQNPERDARAYQANLAQEREALVERTEQALGMIDRWFFRLFLGWAQRFTPNREDAIFYVGAAWPTLRRLALELGRRLAESGSLHGPDDVFFLNSAELKAAIEARANGAARPGLVRLAQTRRTLREARKRLDPPVAVPPNATLQFGPFPLTMFEPRPSKASEGATLQGFAVSPGRVTAAASVIRSPQDFEKMTPDTILVCPTTTPAWTPLFAQAAGLVTDIGGALAHGSIVAREYGIPAVMGTGAATRRIRHGQQIQVDGDSGTVTLVDEAMETAETETTEAEPATTDSASKSWEKILFILAAGLIALFVWRRKRQPRRTV